MALFNNDAFMWFGTEQRMGWIITPETGANVSASGLFTQAGLQNGGAAVRHSWDSAQSYSFSWGESESKAMVTLMQAYRNGSYGRGLIYFLDPLHFDTNLLPKRWADPSMAVNYEAEPLVRDVFPTAVASSGAANGYPLNSASYQLPANYNAETAGTELFIPIPEGHTLLLGAAYSGAGQIYARTSTGANITLPQLPTSGPVATTVINAQWVRLGIRNPNAAVANIVISGMTARVGTVSEASTGDLGLGPWRSGNGHSGCRFVADPQVVNYNGIDGGQFGLTANFQEVGAWVS